MKNTLDLGGVILPFTMLKFSNRFGKLVAGEILEIIGTNPDTGKEILEISATLPCEVLYVHKREDRYLIRVRKLGA